MVLSTRSNKQAYVVRKARILVSFVGIGQYVPRIQHLVFLANTTTGTYDKMKRDFYYIILDDHFSNFAPRL